MVTEDARLTPSTEILVSPSRELHPAPLFTPTPKAAKRVLEFFTAQINNGHTRKAYLNATRRFAEWCDAYSIRQLADVQPFPCRCFREGPPGRIFAAHGQAVPGGASHALRLAGDRPHPRRESGPRRCTCPVASTRGGLIPCPRWNNSDLRFYSDSAPRSPPRKLPAPLL